MNYEKIIEGYEELRKKCYELAIRNKGALMHEDAWLRTALCDEDIEMMFYPGGIHCRGSVFTCQTQSIESFSFNIPLEELEKYAS